MNNVYHSRGFWRGLLRQPLWHVRECARSPAYRALHRFHRQLGSLPRFAPAVVRYRGLPIELADAPSFLSAWDEIFVNGIYDVPVAAGDVPVLVDAGANIGLAALYWKLRYGEFRYLGFEPDPRIAGCCRRNLAAWQVNGELIEAAVGAAPGRAEFVPDGADGGRLNAGASAAGSLGVQVRRLSEHLPERVDLLKIDVEGAEAGVVADVLPRLAAVRALFVEVHGQAGRGGVGAIIAQIESAGFDCYVQVAFGPDRPFHRPPASGVFCQNLNVYAVRP